MKKKKIMVNVRLDKSDHLDLKRTAKAIKMPVSQFAREAFRDKIASLKKTHPALQPADVATVSA